MAQASGVHKAVGALADATGRSEEEVRLALTVAAVVAGLMAAVRFLDRLAGLGADVFRRVGG
jgi:hypothetical protein